MRESIAIIGGGVAGLSAAHELIERGFDVHVYERRPSFGGKAASYRWARTDEQPGALGVPGEHGFRFFPGWYRHLLDTMQRIPFHKTNGGRHTVADNLVSVESNLLAWAHRAPVSLPVHLPRSRAEAAIAGQFLGAFRRLGLTPGEVGLFAQKMVEFLALSDERRAERFEGVSWWDYLDCSHPERSAAYKDLARATTRTMVAAKAEEVSAYTIGRLAVRTLMDTLASFDRVLNGPTNEVWIDPWIDHLTARGVKFHTDVELREIEIDRDRQRVKRLLIEPVLVADARRLRELLGHLGERAGDEVHEEFGRLCAAMQGTAARAEDALGPLIAALLADPHAFIDGASPVQIEQVQLELAAFEARPRASATVTADHFILALPLEQLAYYVNRSTMLTYLAPELRNVVRLTRHMDWMAGIQFYLRTPCDITPGHLVGMDAPWALTAIEHTQFWKDIDLPPDVRAILSVDISAWDKIGNKTRKEAFNCSNHEIAQEVWAQLQELVNKPGRPTLLRDEMLVDGHLADGRSYHLDHSIVDLHDRKKQAFYERARGVRFSTLDLVRKDEGDGPASAEPSYVWGPRLRFNAEPLLVNRAGSRKLRPDVRTSIHNLFVAGDFVKTETDLACMEGANEAARRAVNAILDACDSREARCQLWPFSPSRGFGDAVRGVVGMYRGLGAAQKVAHLQSRILSGLADGFARRQTRQTDVFSDEETLTRK